MEKVIAKVERVREIIYEGKPAKIKVTALVHDLGQGAYFSITGTIGPGFKMGGCIHDEIEEYFPDLAKYIKWHLCSMNDGPMHYIENSLYHAGWTKYTEALNIDHFKSTAIWGALESDNEIDITSLMNNDLILHTLENGASKVAELRKVLEARKPKLMEKMHEDLLELFGFSYQGIKS